tara:strand:- start:501 stop:806 length:306 start_codon:yes stop_codon:yes gene_type:complete
MAERTVTEENIRDALKNNNLNPEHIDFKRVLKDLFPPLFVPKGGEVIVVSDYEDFRNSKVRVFSHITNLDTYVCLCKGAIVSEVSVGYRFVKALTPTQKGE